MNLQLEKASVHSLLLRKSNIISIPLSINMFKFNRISKKQWVKNISNHSDTPLFYYHFLREMIWYFFYIFL